MQIFFFNFSYFRPANINLFFNISKHDFAYYSRVSSITTEANQISIPYFADNQYKKNSKEYFFRIFQVSDLRQVSDSPRVFRFPPPIKLTPQYKWNIVESDIKHHNPNHYPYFWKEQIVSLIYKFSEGFCLFLYMWMVFLIIQEKRCIL